MIRDVVIHIHNEQPVLADLLAEPSPADVTLICTNLRSMNGSAPVFVERGDSTFVFPLVHVRFVEIRPGSGMETAAAADEPAPPPVKPARRLESGKKAAAHQRQPEPETADEPAEDYPPPLDRLAWVSGEAAAPPEQPPASQKGKNGGPETADGPDPDGDELIWRIREV